MKAYIVQPPYSRELSLSDAYFEERLQLLDRCEDADIIVLPEYSMPAFGAAVAMGAEEIEFDLWPTKDGVLVSCHDGTLDRVSDGHGKIYEHTYEKLLQLDFGAKCGEKFRGLKIPTFEEILRRFAGRVIMNIHVKHWDCNFPDPMIQQIVSLIRKYDAQRHVYFMTTNDAIIRQVMAYAPDIPCCVGWDGNKDPMSMVDRAIALGAYKVQLFKPYFSEETVKKPMPTVSSAMSSGLTIRKKPKHSGPWASTPS